MDERGEGESMFMDTVVLWIPKNLQTQKETTVSVLMMCGLFFLMLTAC